MHMTASDVFMPLSFAQKQNRKKKNFSPAPTSTGTIPPPLLLCNTKQPETAACNTAVPTTIIRATKVKLCKVEM